MNVLVTRCSAMRLTAPHRPTCRPQKAACPSLPPDGVGPVIKLRQELIDAGFRPNAAEAILTNFVPTCCDVATKSDIKMLDQKLNWVIVLGVVTILTAAGENSVVAILSTLAKYIKF